MCAKKGFTLIESMVVLGILAIIAVLGYNFFGRTIKEARLSASVTQVYKIMTSVDSAWEDLERKGITAISSDCHELVDNNLLREVPGITNIYGHLTGSDYFWCRQDVWNSGGLSAANDDVVYGWFFNDEFCKKFNERYTNLGATIPLDPGAADPVFFNNPQGVCAHMNVHGAGNNTVRLAHKWK